MRYKAVFFYVFLIGVILFARTVASDTDACIGPERLISMLFTGDIMPGTDYPDRRAMPPGNDCAALFEPVKGVLSDADVTFGNLEGAVAGTKGTAKPCHDPRTCYVFRIPEACILVLKQAGFNFLSVANNHANDFGAEGRQNTLEVIDRAEIGVAGFANRKFSVRTINSIRIGFCAFSANINVCDLRDMPTAREIVRQLRKQCDLLVVSMHGGAEGRSHLHVTRKQERYLGENRGNVHAFAHAMIDEGADIVFGHGPHVPRAIELHRNKLILYSLGNFCTYRRFNLRGENGIAPVVKVWLDTQGDFVSGKIFSFRQNSPGGPIPDEKKQAVQLIKRLTEQDFPDQALSIFDDGEIVRNDRQ